MAPQSGGCAAWSKINDYGPPSTGNGKGPPFYPVSWIIPVLIAAVDPVAEAKLDGLNQAVVSGHYLTENCRRIGQSLQGGTVVPGAGVLGQRHERVRGHPADGAERASRSAGDDAVTG